MDLVPGTRLTDTGPARFRGELLKFNVNTDKVLRHELDERVRAVLRFVKACAKANVSDVEGTADTPETAALLRKIGAESLVLLKNEAGVLPLNKDKKVNNPPPPLIENPR